MLTRHACVDGQRSAECRQRAPKRRMKNRNNREMKKPRPNVRFRQLQTYRGARSALQKQRPLT
jgi:hypothetical protein